MAQVNDLQAGTLWLGRLAQTLTVVSHAPACPPRACYINRLRSLDGAIPMDSRYLATVRRATWIPCASSRPAILLSLNGFLAFSAATSFLMMARIAVDEHSPPSAVLTWLEKK